MKGGSTYEQRQVGAAKKIGSNSVLYSKQVKTSGKLQNIISAWGMEGKVFPAVVRVVRVRVTKEGICDLCEWSWGSISRTQPCPFRATLGVLSD